MCDSYAAQNEIGNLIANFKRDIDENKMNEKKTW